jgi:hypothetical protein
MRTSSWGKLATTLVAAIVLAPTGAAFATPASGDKPSLTGHDDRTVEETLEKFGVPIEQRAGLLAAAAAQQPWDVYLPDAEPSTVEHDVEIDGFSYTIERYADGSISATGLEIPKDNAEVGAQEISQCSYSTGSGYHNATNCQLDGIWGTVLIGASGVSYTLVQGASDRITDTGYGYQKCNFPTFCSSPALVMSQLTEGPGSAYARWQSDVSAAWGTWNIWLQLNVGGDSAWQTNS